MEQKGFCLWFTGLPCSGKTTVADALAEKLLKQGLRVERLDGDIVRKSLTRDLGFSRKDRDLNIERITFVSRLLSRNRVATLVTFVSPYIAARNKARKECTNFVEAFVDCPVEECEKRDVKGMYKKARAGIIKDFTGVDDPYEIPPNPELVLKTKDETVEESVAICIAKLEELGLIESPKEDLEEETNFSQEDEEQIRKQLQSRSYL